MGAYSNYPDGIDGSHPYFNQPDAPEETWECPECGYVASDDEMRYCPYCGIELQHEEETERDLEAEYGDYLYDMYVDRKVMGE